MSLRLLMLVLGVWLVGCTPARREVQGRILRNTHFSGNGGLFGGSNDYALRAQMAQKNSAFGLTVWPLLYVIEPQALRDDVLARDAWRLEMWYAHHGWFDARVLGWQIREVRRGSKRRAAVVDAIGFVDRGVPTLVRSVDVQGLTAGSGLARSALRRNGFEEGVQFDLDAVDAVENEMLANLQNHSFAYATVTSRIAAYPEEFVADVSFLLSPGITSAFGPITITGNEKVKTKYIEENLEIEEGESYDRSKLDETQRALFGMGTFSVVSIEPDLSAPDNPAVPVRINVSESRFRTLRLGGGLTFDGIDVTPRASVRYTQDNIARELIRLELGAIVGLTYPTDEIVGDLDGNGAWVPEPTWDLTASVKYPRLAGPNWGIEIRGRHRRDEQAGLWMFENPEADLTVSYSPNRKLLVRFGPHYELYRYLLETQDTALFARTLFGKSFTNPYTLTALDQQVILDQRDDPLFTSRGWYGALFTREVLPVRDDSYAFLLGDVEGRVYSPLGRVAGDLPFVGALRLHGKYLYPFEGRALPYPELAFLGGSNSLRGFRTSQVGPYDTLCTYPTEHGDVGDAGIASTAVAEGTDADAKVTRYHLPHGGQAAIDGSAELRYDWAYGVSFATFADIGWLAENVNRSGLQDIRWNVGVGTRYRSPIGPIRLDLAFRPLYPEDDGPTEVIGCDPADVEPRYYDLFSLFGGTGANRPPVAMLVFLAIGEAF